jgi:hypothetical protein
VARDGRKRFTFFFTSADKSRTRSRVVYLINLVEDGDPGLLGLFDNLPSIAATPNGRFRPSSFSFLYVHSFRGHRSERSAMHPAVKIDQSVFQSGLILNAPGRPESASFGRSRLKPIKCVRELRL